MAETNSLPQTGQSYSVLESGTPRQLVDDMKDRKVGEIVYCIGPDLDTRDKYGRIFNMSWYVQSWRIRTINDPIEDSIVEFLGWGIIK